MDVVLLRTITQLPDLHIAVVRGQDQLDVALSGAHASEQPDPTPWLAGGELLMSDGLAMTGSATEHAAYVERLAHKGVAALVLGLGGDLPFAECPPGLIDGAERCRLPLLTVPVSTPFIAITQAFYACVAEERSALSERILKAHNILTSAAASAAPLADIASATANLIDGWVRIYDAAGRPLHPQAALGGEIEEALARQLRQFSSNARLHSSVAESNGRGSLAVQPVGIDRLRGMLAYGRDGGGLSEPFTRAIAAYTTSLLSIELERRHAMLIAERRPGAEVVRRLLGGVQPSRIGQLLATVGFTGERVQLLIVDADTPSVEQIADRIEDIARGALVLITGSSVKALIPADSAAADPLRELVGERCAGLGGPVRPQNFAATARQAEQALAEARRCGRGLIDAMRLGDVQILLQLLSANELTSFADAVLGPVENAANGLSLLHSLNAFLASGTAVEQGSQQAHVHRHTMRRHLRRIEELTGRELQDSRHRNEFWLAFKARDIAATLQSV